MTHFKSREIWHFAAYSKAKPVPTHKIGNMLLNWCFRTLVLILLTRIFSVHSKWRYENTINTYDLFSTQYGIKLVFLDSSVSEIEWQIPIDCTMTNKSFEALMQCDQPGIYPVTVSQGIGPSAVSHPLEYIRAGKVADCYLWYLSSTWFVSTGSDIHPLLHDLAHDDEEDEEHTHLLGVGYVWIYDEQYASEEELNGTASGPSAYSRLLSRQFHELGQLPDLSLEEHGLHSQHIDITLQGFNASQGYWIVLLDMMVHNQPDIIISGKAVDFNNCFVRDTAVLLPHMKFNFSGVINQTNLLFDSFVRPAVIQDPCTSNVAALLTRFGILLTQDNFETYQKMEFTQQISNLASQNVSEVAFTSEHLVLLIEGRLWKVEQPATLVPMPGQPNVTLIGLRSRDWCREGNDAEEENRMLAAWSHTDLYTSDGRNFTHVILPPDLYNNSNFNGTVMISDVAFDTFPWRLGVTFTIMKDNSSMVGVALYDISKGQWQWLQHQLIAETAMDLSEKQFSMKFINAGLTSFLLSTNHSVLYFYSHGGECGLFTRHGCNTSSLLTAGQTIQQAVISTHGEIVFLTSNNQMLYSQSQEHTVIQLESGELPETDMLLWFNSAGNLYILKLDGPKIHKRLYPLKNAIYSAFHPQHSCPYTSFSSTKTDLFYMDMGECTQIQTEIIYPSTEKGTVQVNVEGEDLVSIKCNTTMEYSRHVLTEHKTYTIKQHKDISTDSNREQARIDSTGIVVLELRPAEVNLACPSPTNMVSYISVGCPEGRHIRIHRNEQESCANLTSYTIPRGTYFTADGSVATEDRVVQYNQELLGCPLRILSQDNFLPLLDLYDELNYVKPMTADFIAWEEYGRFGYTYNATMKEAGCERKAQTWRSMKDISGETDPDRAWGIHNYQHCFSDDIYMGASDLSQRYEILNRSGAAAIKFSEEYNGIYIFHFKVVDPNYSFCNLHVPVAISVYGAKEDRDLTILGASLLTISLVILIGLASTYFLFRKDLFAQIAALDMQNEDS